MTNPLPKTITGHGCPKQLKGRGPNGRRFCRWCHAEVPKGRSSYCDDECRKYCDFGYSKIFVRQRDKCICSICGCDPWRLDRLLSKYCWAIKREVLRELGWVNRTGCRFEEYDHIKQVKDGGSHHPDNLRTLCRPCHLDVSKEQRQKNV